MSTSGQFATLAEFGMEGEGRRRRTEEGGARREMSEAVARVVLGEERRSDGGARE